MSSVFVIVKKVPARTDEFRYPDDGLPFGMFVSVKGSREQAKSWIYNKPLDQRKDFQILERKVSLA
jgi:hypothetical protein